jgi:transposase
VFGFSPWRQHVSLLEDAIRRQRISGAEICESAQRFCRISTIEIVKRSDQVSGFVVLPKRWIVKRTIAWLNRCRGFAKGLGECQPKGARVLAPRLNPPHAQKTSNPT